MVDDKLGISVCGYKTKKLSEFLNRRTNLNNLQFDRHGKNKLHELRGV